jgi:hypothetical protein
MIPLSWSCSLILNEIIGNFDKSTSLASLSLSQQQGQGPGMSIHGELRSGQTQDFNPGRNVLRFKFYDSQRPGENDCREKSALGTIVPSI